MEILALTHTYVAYEDSTIPELRSLKELGLTLPSSAWIGLMAIAVALTPVVNVPQVEAAGAVTVIATNGLNIRSGPGTSYAITGGLSNGAIVATTGAHTNGFIQLRNGGWISANYTSLGSGSNEGSTSSGPDGTVRVTSRLGLNVRSGPGTGYQIVGGLPSGAVVTVYDYSNGWYRVSNGWIAAAYTTGGGSTTSDPTPSGAVTVATRSGIGVNARYGPGFGYGIATAYPDGAVLSTTGAASNGWLELNNGLWVSSNYVY